MAISRKEFIEKYGDVEVKFSRYYKYTFSFSGKTEDGANIHVSYGGNHDDIYRFGVEADLPVKIKDMDPHAGVVERNGEQEDEFYEYY